MRRSADLLNSTARGLHLVISARAISLTTGVAQAQTTWFVEDANSPDPGSGTEDDPFCIIQDGIDADPLFVDPDGDGTRRLTILALMMENPGSQHDEETLR